jgi:hypothetical protein
MYGDKEVTQEDRAAVDAIITDALCVAIEKFGRESASAFYQAAANVTRAAAAAVRFVRDEARAACPFGGREGCECSVHRARALESRFAHGDL